MTNPTDADIQEMLERCEDATEGPWVEDGTRVLSAAKVYVVAEGLVREMPYAEAAANVRFIATVRTDHPAVLTSLQTARGLLRERCRACGWWASRDHNLACPVCKTREFLGEEGG